MAAVLPGCSSDYSHISNLRSPRTQIIFFGDSLTAGYHVAPEEAFPAIIGKRLGLPCINAGRKGDTTVDGLARLEDDVLALKPRLVVVEFGGNDFRRRLPEEVTLANLDSMVQQIVDSGSMAVVLHIRIGLLRDKYLSGCKRVCSAHGALLIRNFMSGILGSSKLTLDGIHPTPEGHELIAQRVLDELIPLLEASNRAKAGNQQAP